MDRVRVGVRVGKVPIDFVHVVGEDQDVPLVQLEPLGVEAVVTTLR